MLFAQSAPAAQAWPHEPQFALSVVRFDATPPEHCICPEAQLVEHAPLLQTCVPVQVLPHMPQLLASEATQAPLQFSWPAPHTQVPDWHVEPAPQVLPQAPQFCGSVPIRLMH